MSLEAEVVVVLGDVRVEVALTVATGEVVAVLGPNGAGKTTVLRALAGLVPLDAGRVVLDGEVLDDVAAGRRVPTAGRAVGMVFQDGALFPHLSLLDNVAFGLRAHGRGRAAARRQAATWLARVGLDVPVTSLPGTLSGGEAQRVALARALAVEPRLLLLDEPFSALDASARGSARRELGDHLRRFGGTRVLVTHDPVEAAALADRLVVVEEGRVVQTGSPADVAARPRTRYVADLVGVNLFAGRAEGGHVVLDAGPVLVVPDAGRGPVLVALHPRAVALHRRRPEGTPRNVWPAKLIGLDEAGERVRVRTRAGDGLEVVAEVTAAAAHELRLDEGGDCWLSVKATEVVVYPG